MKLEKQVRDIHERRLGRELNEAEVSAVVDWYCDYCQRILEWVQDEEFCRRLGVLKQVSFSSATKLSRQTSPGTRSGHKS